MDTQQDTHTSAFKLLIVSAICVIVVCITAITVLFLGSGARAALVTAPHMTTQQQGTFEFKEIATGSGRPSSGPIPQTPLITGGPVAPSDPFYCIDDEDPEGCDDQTAFHVPKGVGGSSGQCGTVIQSAHSLVTSLPQGLKDFRDSLNPSVINSCHSSGTYSGGYISPFFVIDAFNLAGFSELSKSDPNQITGAGMLSWWQTSPPGYKYIPYTPTILQDYAMGTQNLTGCVMFIQMPSGGVHVGIVNVFEVVNAQGDGVLSILQSGARYFLDRFPVVGWDVKNTQPLHQTVITGVTGFGCHS